MREPFWVNRPRWACGEEAGTRYHKILILTEASTKTPMSDQTTNVLKMVVLFKTYNATEVTEVVGAYSMLCDM